MGQGMVEVASLGVDSLGAGQITATELAGQALQPNPGAVIEQPHLKVGIIQIQTTPQGSLHHLQGLTAAGHQHRNPGERTWIAPPIIGQLPCSGLDLGLDPGPREGTKLRPTAKALVITGLGEGPNGEP